MESLGRTAAAAFGNPPSFLLDAVAARRSGPLPEISKTTPCKGAEAACGLAILAREVCDEMEIFTFSQDVKKAPPRRGFALRDAIITRSRMARPFSARR